MGFGIEEPTHMAFSMTFDENTDQGNIKLVVDQLIDDGWEVSYDAELRQLFAKNEIVKIAPPTVIQGPPDMEYMAKKAFEAHAWPVSIDHPYTEWGDLPELEQDRWFDVATALLGK